MPHLTRVLLAVPPALAVLCLGASVFAQPVAAKRYAVLAGVNKYQHADLTDLRFAEADATEVAKVLKAAGYETTLLVGRNATRTAVEKAVRDAGERCKAGDTLVVGLAGHGLQFEGDKDAYFCPVDARPLKTDVATLVPVNGLYASLQRSYAGAKFLLVDACRNDPAGGRGTPAPEPPPRGVGVLLSCSAGERAFEHEKLGHGVFFHSVIEGLKGKARDGRGRVTWDGLRGYVKDQVSEQVPKLIGGGAKQQPNDKGDLSGASPVLITTDASVADTGRMAAPSAGGALTTNRPAMLKAPFTETEAKAARSAWANYLRQGGEKVIDVGGGVKLELILVPPGTFRMGSPVGEVDRRNEEELHTVTIDQPFYLGKYEVTQAEYRAITGETPSDFKGDRLPAERVSWSNAVACCKKLNVNGAGVFGLPTEAEWEYACRAGTETPFHFGTSLNGDKANINGTDPYGTTSKGQYLKMTCAVGRYESNQFGLHDMHGNVAEWCHDYYGPYSAVEGATNPLQLKNQSRGRHVMRGGSWNRNAWDSRAGRRGWSAATGADKFNYFGFRVCLRLD